MTLPRYEQNARARFAQLDREERAKYALLISPPPASLAITTPFIPQILGVIPKLHAHTPWTPMHWAFSVHIITDAGEVLLQQRALHKPTWGGVWSGSCCGHVVYGETVEESLRQRVHYELGIEPSALYELTAVLPGYTYGVARDDGLVGEHELCPVYIARVHDRGSWVANPEEVAATDWIPLASLLDRVNSNPASLSPWTVEQIQILHEHQAFPAS
jgi:isopentenyl-diphosphate delta-isomerase